MELSVHCPCPPLPGRPFFVEQDGVKTYISVHDMFHLEQERRYKQNIFVHHPDRNKRLGKGKSVVISLLKSREAWRRKETKWYAQFSLETPEKGKTRCNQKPMEVTPLLAA